VAYSGSGSAPGTFTGVFNHLLMLVTVNGMLQRNTCGKFNQAGLLLMHVTPRYRGHRANRRVVVRGVAAMMLMPIFHSSAQAQMALASAINRTARFRALSQRIAKAYCQLYLNVQPALARDVLVSARQLVAAGGEELAKGLNTGPWPAHIAALLGGIQKHVDVLNSLLTMPPTQESVRAVALQVDKFLITANTTTETIEKLSAAGSARLLNTVGRQRMLSQRLAKNYFLVAAKLGEANTPQQMIADAAEFKSTLSSLAKLPITTANIRNELTLGEQQWVFFEAALRNKADESGLRNVATASERLLEVMDKLTGLYEVALKDVLG
jgi:hypothetical protein